MVPLFSIVNGLIVQYPLTIENNGIIGGGGGGGGGGSEHTD